MGLTLCEALEHLHRGGVVHLDIKPSNIGFTRDHVVKLFDFGLARVLVTDEAGPDAATTERRRPHASSASTVTAGPFGTPAYMSPEAIAGQAPGPTFDVWALSVVLYEALAGRRPFEGNGFSVLSRVGAAAPPEITTLRPGLSPEFSEFFAAALAGDPGLRLPSVAALREHLSRLPAHQG